MYIAQLSIMLNVCVQGESKKSRPPTTFNDIFAWAESFCIEFCTFIGSLYRMCSDFGLFILTFNEMALILLRAPTICTKISSSTCSPF